MFTQRISRAIAQPANSAVRTLANPRVDHATADRQALALLPLRGLVRACRIIASWPAYSCTPLVALPGRAANCGLGALWIKDEGPRFGLGSFKALGGAYAVAAAVDGAHGSVTVASATDGNHGRSVAWGAQQAGCRCVIYLHETVSEKRERAIRAYGAEVVRTAGNYDDSSHHCSRDAGREGWIVVSDTAEPGDPGMALVVMQGYGVMVDEAAQQLRGNWPTHVFVQAGCGGLAAAVRAHFATLRGERALPFFVVVEPLAADCLYRSAVAGERQVVHGNLDTMMAGLAVGETSAPAWEILSTGVDAFVAMPDEPALEAMRVLADPPAGDPPVVAGETGAVGLGALLAIQSDTRAHEALRLDAESRVLVINTESDTDPDIYDAVVGRPAAAVRGDVTYGIKETIN